MSGNKTYNWLSDKAAHMPLNPAAITWEGAITFKELLAQSVKAAGYLSEFEIQENDNIGILLRHTHSFYVIINALWILGAVPVPLDIKLSQPELSVRCAGCDIKLLIMDDYNDSSFASFDEVPRVVFSLHCESQELPPKTKSFSEDKTALIMYTSGSSGKPKAAVHTFKSLSESVKLTDSVCHFSEKDTMLASLPFNHIGGFMILVRCLLSGSAALFPESLQFEDICSAMAELNPSIISIVPTTLLRLLENNISPNGSLKCVFLGGGPADTGLITAGIEKGWPLVKVYGSTETCSMITAITGDELKEKPASAGRKLNGVEFCIKGEELIIKSPSLFKEYYKDKHGTEKKVIDGFYHTGDYAGIDEEGALFIESRREDFIVSGGENISASEVETAIKWNESVFDVCVVPVPDVKWGQIVCAAVILKDKALLTPEKIKTFLTGMIAPYKIPKKTLFLKEFPRTGLGKTDRSSLIEMFKNLPFD